MASAHTHLRTLESHQQLLSTVGTAADKPTLSSSKEHVVKYVETRRALDTHVNAARQHEQLYPPRWYDSILPANLPFDSRETVHEASSRIRETGDLALWQAEHKDWMSLQTQTCYGSIVCCAVVAVLVLVVVSQRQRVGGNMLPECYNPVDYVTGCEIYPLPKLLFMVASIIIILTKLITLDMTQGPYGALPLSLKISDVELEGLPNVLSGLVPESQREGVAGTLERVLAIWHGVLGAFLITLLLLFCYFPRNMLDRYPLAPLRGPPLLDRQIIFAPPGTLDVSAQIGNCSIFDVTEIYLAAQVFFGVDILFFFLFGALLFSIGEIFKLRYGQLWPGKGFINVEWLLRVASPFFWSSELRDLQVAASKTLAELNEQQRSTHKLSGAQKCDAQIMNGINHVCSLVQDAAHRHLLIANRVEAIGQYNRSRLLWTAAFQAAGLALWVPAAQANVQPCLHEMNRFVMVSFMSRGAIGRMQVLQFSCWLVFIVAVSFFVFMGICLPSNVSDSHFLNPSSWHVRFPEKMQTTLQRRYDSSPPMKEWCNTIVHLTLGTFFAVTVLFGELGALSFIDDTWIPNPWAAWQFQVMLYAAEIAVRFFCSKFVRKGVALPSPAEEAAYAVEVESHLLDVLHEFWEAGRGLDDVERALSAASLKLHAFIIDVVNNHPDAETGSPLLKKQILKEFVVDNRWLDAKTDGLGYRQSKNLDDLDSTRPPAAWFSSVHGYDEEDGWIRVQDGSFLPTFINGKAVLTVPLR